LVTTLQRILVSDWLFTRGDLSCCGSLSSSALRT